jgi:hypothetical protein
LLAVSVADVVLGVDEEGKEGEDKYLECEHQLYFYRHKWPVIAINGNQTTKIHGRAVKGKGRMLIGFV